MAAGAIWDAATACSGAASGAGDRFACGGQKAGGSIPVRWGREEQRLPAQARLRAAQTPTGQARARRSAQQPGPLAQRKTVQRRRRSLKAVLPRLLPTRGAGPTPNSCCVTAKILDGAGCPDGF